MLGVLTAEQLRHAVFPIGDTPKPQIREEAARRGLAVAEKPDSHDICFIPSGDTQRVPRRRIGVRRGAVVDAGGTVLAEHEACTASPSGSAKGLGIAGPGPDGRPRYVTGIDADTGTVHVGDAAELDVWTLTGDKPVFTSGVAPGGPVEVPCRCARTAASPTAWPSCATGSWWLTCVPRCVAWRLGRQWCSIVPIPTGMRSSVARRSFAGGPVDNLSSCQPVASCQDAREGGFVASCDRARLGTWALVVGPALLVVIVSSCAVRAWIWRWVAAGLIRE